MKSIGILSVLTFTGLLFAEPAFKDRRGLDDWKNHESRINTAIEAGAVGMVEGEMPDPNIIRDSSGIGRIAKYEKLFVKNKEGVVFNKKYDFIKTVESGEFHQGHLWEALWRVEGNGMGRFFLPGFEKGGEGCELLLHFRYDKWTDNGFEHGKEQRCVDGNRIFKMENKVVRVWKTQIKMLGDALWKQYPDKLTSGLPELAVDIDVQGRVTRCEVVDDGKPIEILKLKKMCEDYLTSGGKGHQLAIKLPL